MNELSFLTISSNGMASIHTGTKGKKVTMTRSPTLRGSTGRIRIENAVAAIEFAALVPVNSDMSIVD